ncbi:hypothetical protein AB3N04_01030 (plasmid) [Alkalihalophilus sp. As8PL]|uniref:Uncharacterized protein n=1 Tax=Alkalihalophilus sp. As8PL TaxID=3237103 RepID=A0AB39BNQ0_9BACI
MRTKKNEPNFIMDWINSQSNISESLRQLIERDVAENGLRDVNDDIINKAAIGSVTQRQSVNRQYTTQNEIIRPIETVYARNNEDFNEGNIKPVIANQDESLETKTETTHVSEVLPEKETRSMSPPVESASERELEEAVAPFSNDESYEAVEVDIIKLPHENNINGVEFDPERKVIEEDKVRNKEEVNEDTTKKKKVKRGHIDINQWS